MANKKSSTNHRGQIRKRFGELQELINDIEKYAANLRAAVNDIEENLEDYINNPKKKVPPVLLGQGHRSYTSGNMDEERMVRQVRKLTRGMINMFHTAQEKDRLAKHRKKMNQRFTNGALVERDNNAVKTNDWSDDDRWRLFNRVASRSYYVWDRKTGDYVESNKTLKVPQYNAAWKADQGAGRREYLYLQPGMHAVIIDTKTSKTYVQIQLGNHRYWMKRDHLKVVQN